MISLLEYIKYNFKNEYIPEMTTVAKNIRLDNRRQYKIAIHGPSTKDRDYPHIHIYDYNDHSLKKFNFEISLIDILCYDEINIIAQVDKDRNIKRMNRNKCSWEGYRKLYEGFENWLYSDNLTTPGDFVNNLEAVIWHCNNESYGPEENYVLYYIRTQGKKVLNKFRNLFSEEDQNNYKDVLNYE